MPSHNSYCLTWVSLTLDVGYLFMAAPAKRSHCSLPWTRSPLLTLKVVAPLGPLARMQPPLLGCGVAPHCKEQYHIGTWNVRSMNQGNLEMVKQEMARVNTDILGISKLKWRGMGEFNSYDHYIYYCGQESLRRNGVAIMVNKRA